MKSYSLSSGAKAIGHFLPFLLICLGSLAAYAAYVDHIYPPLIFSAICFYMAFHIINNNLIVIVIDSNKLIFKKPFTANTEYDLLSLKDFALLTLQNKNNGLNGDSSQRMGKHLGNLAVSMAAATTKNATNGVQFLAKDSNNKLIMISTNFINNSNQLITDIKNIIGVDFEHISSSEIKAWKSGDLYLYRKDPDLINRKRIKQLSPYINIKVLIFLPISIVLLALITNNLWFNWAQYEYYKIADRPYSKDFVTLKENPEELNVRGTTVNIYLQGEAQPILKKINTNNRVCSIEGGGTEKFKYYFYPYQRSYCFKYLLNLDEDSEPEIIYRHEVEKYTYQFRVYDFNTVNQDFISKPISFYSKTLEQYIDILKSNKSPSWKYIFDMIFIFLSGFLVFSVITLLVFNYFKKSIKPRKEA